MRRSVVNRFFQRRLAQDDPIPMDEPLSVQDKTIRTDFMTGRPLERGQYRRIKNPTGPGYLYFDKRNRDEAEARVEQMKEERQQLQPEYQTPALKRRKLREEEDPGLKPESEGPLFGPDDPEPQDELELEPGPEPEGWSLPDFPDQPRRRKEDEYTPPPLEMVDLPGKDTGEAVYTLPGGKQERVKMSPDTTFGDLVKQQLDRDAQREIANIKSRHGVPSLLEQSPAQAAQSLWNLLSKGTMNPDEQRAVQDLLARVESGGFAAEVPGEPRHQISPVGGYPLAETREWGGKPVPPREAPGEPDLPGDTESLMGQSPMFGFDPTIPVEVREESGN